MLKYIILVALGAISYGTLTSFAKIAYGQGYSAGEITFVQALLGAMILWSLAILRNIRKKQKLKLNWRLVLAGTSMGFSAYCFYYSVKFIPVALAIVLLMQVSWIGIIGEWLIFKKKPSRLEIATSVIIIIGTVLAGNLMHIQSMNFSMTGIALATGAAFLYTIYVLSTSKLGNDTPMLEKSALMTTGSALMILLINFPSITASTHLDFGLLRWGTFLAVFGTVIPPICFTTGMPKIGPGLSTILLTLELPAVVLCAYLILGEKVTVVQIIGIIIMISAIIYLNIVKNKREKSKDKLTEKQLLSGS
ncbi:EamA family transporter [Sphingobacterium sp. HSC-15S19]|uniref:EamA family transporter n=1 Tax=Sphingobacterium TaxID=28453 RepID=UPI003D1A53EF